MSLALARKYRPATFDDLIGQEAVSQTLSLALDGNRLSHAYLFSGLRGSGKTSTARIFAKALLCEKGSTAHPCGQCTHCKMAAQNRHMDIIEMDAASSRGIDDIKELIEHTKYKPSSARYKIFIIDEVHMLTNQAFNALLKTLEEPPDFVKFILATTDPLKLPATILSRTQHFRFKKIPQNLVLKHLEHILNLESIGYESVAIEILARSGAGSLRDSLTLLDQAIVYSKNFVDLNTVTGMLGIIEPSILEGLLQSILHQNSDEVLAFIKLAANYEAEMILDELTLYLKVLLLSRDTTFTPMIIERFFRVIAESKNLLSLGSDGEFVLALTLFKMLEALSIKEIDTMIQALEQELKGVETSPKTTPETPLSTSEASTIQPHPSSPPSIEEVHIEEPANTLIPTPSQQSTETTLEPKQAVSTASSSSTQHAQNQQEETVQNSITVNPYQKTFDTLLSKIYDRNYELGQCFERNITFESFKEGKLTWISTAQDSDKKQLITHWGIINMFVKELFGIETKITNISKKKRSDASTGIAENQEDSHSSTSPHTQHASTQNSHNNSPQDTTPQYPLPSHQDADSGSMIEAVEMKSSCIAPDAGETEAAKEKDPTTLLDEPMVKEAIALFDPKKVRIKRNS